MSNTNIDELATKIRVLEDRRKEQGRLTGAERQALFRARKKLDQAEADGNPCLIAEEVVLLSDLQNTLSKRGKHAYADALKNVILRVNACRSR